MTDEYSANNHFETKNNQEEISSLVQLAIDIDDRATERAEKAAVREAEAAVRQADEKKAEREHELALVQLKTQQQNNVPFRPADEVKPRIPPFSDNDDMDSYLARFEKLAQFYGWEKKDYALHLGSLLRAVIQTRAAARKSRDTTPIANMSTLDLPIDKASFLSAQQECDSLKRVWNSYEKDLSTSHRCRAVKYEVIDNLLYRVCKTSKDPTEVGDKQHVRGPLTILHELLTNKKLEKELRTSYQHVLELRQRLEEGAEEALANAKACSVTGCEQWSGVQAIAMSLVELDDTKEGDLNLVGGREITECNINVELSPEQKSDLGGIIDLHPDVLSDVPGKTNSVVHEITLSSSIPVFKKPYPAPAQLRKVVEEEVTRMLEMEIIEPSSSPYCSPVVLVKKSDGSYRLCVEFRFLNDITQFEDHLAEFVDDLYFTELYLCKGYWQLELAPESKIYTAFPTSRGLMQFTRMPFGLKTACASFVRLMRIVLRGLPNTCCYFDNIVIHNKEWENHIRDV
ncbi:hypothetical protein Pcinc_016832 [Petrolisthes cinctipes]|uniref:Reverse transcriptase domain-containing protein n=1 Tax=Petrolisthes cinctipes TaxID=88211 RepID=A0AAE1FQB1_PETCI|nr:hypothetical protein Pcinc_016832 [Petrolisthes cinctipes]